MGAGNGSDEHTGKAALVSNLLVGFVAAALGAIATGIVGYYVWRPNTEAHFYCNPYTGYAPLEVMCFNESQYAAKIMWDFGDGTPAVQAEAPSHVYESHQKTPYVVTLTAFGKGGNKSFTREITVKAPSAAERAVVVSLEALARSGARTVKQCRVDLVNDRHPSLFSEHVEIMTSTPCEADQGYRIVDARFRSESDTRSSVPQISRSSDGRTATVTSRITSGPRADTYRGWLRGVLEVTQEEVNPQASWVDLASDLKIDGYRTYDLQVGMPLEAIEALSLRVDNSTTPIRLPDSRAPFQIPGANATGRLVEGTDRLQLEVRQSTP